MKDCFVRLLGNIKFYIPLDAKTPSYDDTGDSAHKEYYRNAEFRFLAGIPGEGTVPL